MPNRSTAERIKLVAMQARLVGRAGHLTVESIGRGFRELSQALHPDRGGDRATFEFLVEARNALLTQLERSNEIIAGTTARTHTETPQRRLSNG